jgi:hypothetical protein
MDEDRLLIAGKRDIGLARQIAPMKSKTET